MKKILSILFVFAALIASAQQYSVQTVNIGTNAIAANSLLALPISVGTYIKTNDAASYTTNTVITTNNFIKYSVTNKVILTNIFGNVFTNYIGAGTYTTNKIYATNSVVTTNAGYTTNLIYAASKLDVSKSATVAAVLSFKLMGAGTSPVGFGWHLTTDGALTNTVANNQLTVAANGTSVVTTNINFSVGPFGYLNLVYLTNGNATAVTNLTLKVAQKISAP